MVVPAAAITKMRDVAARMGQGACRMFQDLQFPLFDHDGENAALKGVSERNGRFRTRIVPIK